MSLLSMTPGDKDQVTVCESSKICSFGVYLMLLICAQNIGMDPRVWTCERIVRFPSAGANPFVLVSKKTNCSVSLKLDTLPWASIPLEKYRVPARWRDRRERRANVNVFLLISAVANSANPLKIGKMKLLNYEIAGPLVSWTLVPKIIFSARC
jgi:hypothetical protein